MSRALPSSAKILTTGLVLISLCNPIPLHAGEDPLIPLDSYRIQRLLDGRTATCVREHDQATCLSFFGSDGIIKRRMDADGKRREGRWSSDNDQLCVIWDDKPEKTNCWDITDNADGSYVLRWRGKPKALMQHFRAGNTLDF
ncbi:MAG: hypothetical protein ACPGU7_08565 [Gammaproteobacteria bacterium]